MQFFYDRCVIMMDENGNEFPFDKHYFKILTQLDSDGYDWKSYTIEQLGFVGMFNSKDASYIIYDRKLLTKKQCLTLIKKIYLSKFNVFFLIERHGSYKINDLLSKDQCIKLLHDNFNSKDENIPDCQNLAFIDDDIASEDIYISKALEIYNYNKGILSANAFKMLEQNIDVFQRSLIINEQLKFEHFGIITALNMGDGTLSLRQRKNHMQNLEFKDYISNRSKALAHAFNAEKPFFQHVDTTVQFNSQQFLNLKYKVAIFPWKNVFGKYIQTLSNGKYDMS